MDKKPHLSPAKGAATGPSAPQERADRLAAKLRANLARRKQAQNLSKSKDEQSE